MTNALDADAASVQELKECWDRLWAAQPDFADHEFESLRQRWEPLRALDPIVLETDLLSPTGDELYEPAHTKVLAHLLDPAAHGLGLDPIEGLLQAVHATAQELDPSFAAALLARGRALDWNHLGRNQAVAVHAERASRIASAGAAEDWRTDLWIELPSEAPELLIVVENKIQDIARPGQLGGYEAAIAQRLSQLKKAPLVAKVYLTPDGDPAPENAGGEGWLPLDYWTLGLIWSEMLPKQRATASTEFLRLYLATVFQRVLGLRYSEKLTRIQRAQLIPYLKARVGAGP